MSFDDERTLYAKLDEDLQQYAGLLRTAVQTIEDQGVSNYPILVVTLEDLQLGIKLFDRMSSQSKWNVYAATLELLIQLQLIDEQKVDEFRQLFHAKRPSVCLLVWMTGSGSFVFWDPKT
jgi:hypothetical protein